MLVYAVVGLGYVGLGLATALSKHGRVFGYDIDDARVTDLMNNIDRNQLIAQELLKTSKVLYTNNLNAIKDANFYIVCVSTPAYFYETPNLEPLIASVNALGKILKKGDIVVFESTVYPGTTEAICVPILEKMSNLKYLDDFNIGYSPERISPGDTIHSLQNTTKIIAADNKYTLDIIRQTYEKICDTVYPVSSIKIAEAIKILENTQRDVNIAFMNEFAKIMHALNLNTHEIIEGAKTKWSFCPFKPGLVGGHCISIDPHYLAFQAKRYGVYPDLILTSRKINDNMTQFIIQSMLKLLIQNDIDISKINIGILGIAYKENTNDLRNSLSLKLVKELIDYGFNCKINDPMQYPDLYAKHNINLINLSELKNLSVIILTVGHKYYQDIGIHNILKTCKKPYILMDLPNLFINEVAEIKELHYWSL